MSTDTNTASADFKALLAAELAAALAPIQAALTSIAGGDGSLPSVLAAGVTLKGQLILALPTLQKIGINNIAGDVNQLLTAWIASKTTELTAPATTA